MSDTIYRSDAIEEIDKRMDIAGNLGGAFFNGKFNGLYEAQQIIKEAPSVSAEQVTGKLNNPCDSLLIGGSDTCKESGNKLESAEAVQGEWVDIDNYYRMATCSHCHKVTMFEKWGEYTKPYDYCPNCGARMGDGEDKCRQKTGK